MLRRTFLKHTTAFPAVLATGRKLHAAEFDLVIRGGRVIDPTQRMDRMADVAVRAGKIAAIRNEIPAASSAESIDAKGKLVVPGLIDVHLHARDAELPPSE